MNIGYLNNIFEKAKDDNYKYVGVKIDMGYEGYETIINPSCNFDAKQEYYNKAYDECLKLKANNNNIRIVDICYGNSFESIQIRLHS